MRLARLFFTTLIHTPRVRACVRNAVSSATVNPRYSASTPACAETSASDTSPTTAFF